MAAAAGADPSSYGGAPASAGGAGESREIWGTTINIQRSSENFERFVKEFKDADDAQSDEPLYPRLLADAVASGQQHINLNCRHLLAAGSVELYKELVNFPTEIIPIFDLLVNQQREIQFGPYDNSSGVDSRIQVRPFQLHETRNMRELNPEDIDTLVAVKGSFGCFVFSDCLLRVCECRSSSSYPRMHV
jgi:DNA replication licensing factor MCM4